MENISTKISKFSTKNQQVYSNQIHKDFDTSLNVAKLNHWIYNLL